MIRREVIGGGVLLVWLWRANSSLQTCVHNLEGLFEDEDAMMRNKRLRRVFENGTYVCELLLTAWLCSEPPWAVMMAYFDSRAFLQSSGANEV